MTDLAIIAEGLSKSFSRVQALNGVDLRLPYGQVLGVLGPNGAGKTTTIRILSTLLSPDRGGAEVAGFDVLAQPQLVRRVIGLSGQRVAIDEYLTGRENLRMMGRLSRLGRREAIRRADDLVDLFGLGHAADRMARTYSGGMRRRLDVAASLVVDPIVLFLDEPTTGLDPHGRVGVWQLVREMVREGTTVLLTTQYLEEADQLADRIMLIDRGRMVAEGTSSELKSRVGGDRLELWSASPEGIDQLVTAMADLGSGPPEVDRDLNRVVLPVADGPGILAEVGVRLSRARIGVQDLSLRRPTLDDVFIALTQRTTDET
ncbi:MAG TPA: ATP-binding cassette domain-containing protein [Acidimicrobiia bacterium]|nr:ATP-binding cassette domain-containing protein [Acidimicrobiia bacterium]